MSLQVNTASQITRSCEQTVCPRQTATQTVLTVFVVDYLEILDGGLGDSAVEVQHMGRGFFVPHRRLVVELDQIFRPSVLVSYQQPVTILHKTEVN